MLVWLSSSDVPFLCGWSLIVTMESSSCSPNCLLRSLDEPRRPLVLLLYFSRTHTCIQALAYLQHPCHQESCSNPLWISWGTTCRAECNLCTCAEGECLESSVSCNTPKTIADQSNQQPCGRQLTNLLVCWYYWSSLVPLISRTTHLLRHVPKERSVTSPWYFRNDPSLQGLALLLAWR